MAITRQEIKDITLEYRYTSQTAWEEFIDLVFDTADSGFKIKGDIDCSGNPNYPAAEAGDIYRVSVKGKIGGAAGIVVIPGDLIVAWVDNPGGTQAAVGSSWDINQVGLQDIFEISGSDLSFDVVRDLTQTIGRDWTVTTTRNKTEAITGDYTFTVNTNKYIFTVDDATGNTSQTVAGLYNFSVAGSVSESITGNRQVLINTNKYTHLVLAASGDTAETIAGISSRTVGVSESKLVSDRYSRSISAAGVVLEAVYNAVPAITYSKTLTGLTGDCAESMDGDRDITVGGNSSEIIVGTKVLEASNFGLDNLGNVGFLGDVQTGDPGGSGSVGWRLGDVVVGAAVLDNANYVNVMIGGAVKKLALIV